MNSTTVFKLISFVGLALGGIGTILSNWADDKKLDTIIDEKIDKRLSESESEEDDESEES